MFHPLKGSNLHQSPFTVVHTYHEDWTSRETHVASLTRIVFSRNQQQHFLEQTSLSQ